MYYILDAILILVITFCIIFSMKKGFVSVSKSFISLILTWILMSSVQPMLLDALKSSMFGEKIREKVSENISSVYEKEDFAKETNIVRLLHQFPCYQVEQCGIAGRGI